MNPGNVSSPERSQAGGFTQDCLPRVSGRQQYTLSQQEGTLAITSPPLLASELLLQCAGWGAVHESEINAAAHMASKQGSHRSCWGELRNVVASPSLCVRLRQA